ncbi:hypothetical protein C4K00_0482 [Pseudomonas synxantha]|uniref:dermonecrotic toxin domain-containing protein n=1 Tax=Pseudomonas synxantha TaxID=47883 RepID=UPI000F589278|nr:DUF6543 domain-containing protein [Pseudomonas synxantha]AZE70741.1 hypothetical protein C4K00_0482 [Pseudomonas synxantha]
MMPSFSSGHAALEAVKNPPVETVQNFDSLSKLSTSASVYDPNALLKKWLQQQVLAATGRLVDPDKVYLHRFSKSQGAHSADTSTGWKYSGKPEQSMTLTEAVTSNFFSAERYRWVGRVESAAHFASSNVSPFSLLDSSSVSDFFGRLGRLIADRTLPGYIYSKIKDDVPSAIESWRDLDAVYGIYTDGPDKDSYDARNELPLKPSQFLDIVRTGDVQNMLTGNVKKFWTDHRAQWRSAAKGHFVDEARKALNANTLNPAEYALVMGGGAPDLPLNAPTTPEQLQATAAPGASSQVMRFDINGYHATDILRFVGERGKQILYIPGACPVFEVFQNTAELQRWVVEQGKDPGKSAALAHHFSLSDRQQGIYGSLSVNGVDSALSKLGSGEMKADSNHINVNDSRVREDVFTMMARETQARIESDLDTQIKSNSEVYRDDALGVVQSANAVFSIPLALLGPIGMGVNALAFTTQVGLETDQAIEGDTYSERKNGFKAAVTDVAMMAMSHAVGKYTNSRSGARTVETQSSSGGPPVNVSQERFPYVFERPAAFNPFSLKLSEAREITFKGRQYFVGTAPDAMDGQHYLLWQRDPENPSLLVSTARVAKPDASGIWHSMRTAGGAWQPPSQPEAWQGTITLDPYEVRTVGQTPIDVPPGYELISIGKESIFAPEGYRRVRNFNQEGELTNYPLWKIKDGVATECGHYTQEGIISLVGSDLKTSNYVQIEGKIFKVDYDADKASWKIIGSDDVSAPDIFIQPGLEIGSWIPEPDMAGREVLSSMVRRLLGISESANKEAGVRTANDVAVQEYIKQYGRQIIRTTEPTILMAEASRQDALIDQYVLKHGLPYDQVQSLVEVSLKGLPLPLWAPRFDAFEGLGSIAAAGGRGGLNVNQASRNAAVRYPARTYNQEQIESIQALNALNQVHENSPIKIAENNYKKGALNEKILKLTLERDGYKVLPGGQYKNGKSGFDLVLEGPNGNIYVLEAKQIKSVGNGNTLGSVAMSDAGAGGNVQLSDAWVSSVLDNCLAEANSSAARAEVANTPAYQAVSHALQNGTLRKLLGGVTPDGSVLIFKVDFSAYDSAHPR